MLCSGYVCVMGDRAGFMSSGETMNNEKHCSTQPYERTKGFHGNNVRSSDKHLQIGTHMSAHR